MQGKLSRGAIAVTGLLVVAGLVVFGAIRSASKGNGEDDLDPLRWAERFPHQYMSSMKTQLDYGRTEYGGSTPDDKLAANPFRRRAWAGHPFGMEYRAARGHFYAQIDQRESLRTRQMEQPAACIHCHAAEAPGLVAKHGWDAFHRLGYNDLQDQLHHGSSCADCHAPDTMELRVTRPAFVKAMESQGVDVANATREQLRSFVCAQCHVEYYFSGPNRELALPWTHGQRLEDIERHYDEQKFQDWTHAETGAPMIKIQHPEFEFYSTGVHARRGATCADCHMPHTEEDGVEFTDHWIRSPLTNVNNACKKCHSQSEEAIRNRAVAIQRRTTEALQLAEEALGDLMDAIVAARETGASDEDLEAARQFHRRAQLRWDFVDAENSTGFHSSREAARILNQAVELAREGERSALESQRTAEIQLNSRPSRAYPRPTRAGQLKDDDESNTDLVKYLAVARALHPAILAFAVDPQSNRSQAIDRRGMPVRVHVFEDYETDIEKRWWLVGEPTRENVPESTSSSVPNTRCCRATETKNFDRQLEDQAKLWKAVIFNPVPGPPMGPRTRLDFRYRLKGTDTLRVQIYSLSKNYHRFLTLTKLPQEEWHSATVDMTSARRPDGTGGALAEDERIDDIQFYIPPEADLWIDDIVLYEEAAENEMRPFPKRFLFTGWFDTGKQGQEWPGEFEIVPHEKPRTWKAAQSIIDSDTGRPWIRLQLRGPRPLGRHNEVRFRYHLQGSDRLSVVLVDSSTGDRYTADARQLQQGRWAETTVQLPVDKDGRSADELHLVLGRDGVLHVDDVLIYEPGQ